MNILSDLHHESLYYSLQLLFEKRLEHKLYRSIGMTWFKNGYWAINNLEATAKQYLEGGYKPVDQTMPLNEIESVEGNGIVYVRDDHHHTEQRGILFSEFEKMDFDIIIASIPQHIKPFKELARMKNAKFIFQMGNVFNEVNLNEIPNLLANTLPRNIPPTCNYIQYHQEISDVFKPSSQPSERLITSFINVYDHNKGFEDYMALKSIMPSHEFRSYGGQCMDGTITGVENIATIMNRSQFIFHSKYMGDGFGHSLYSAMACGKPVITRISDYKGKLGEELLTHNETCLDLDICNINDISAIISNISPEQYQWMCQQARERFEKCVDYNKEEIEIKEFLDRLI